MNKSEIVATIADELDVTRKDAENAVDTVFKMITQALEDGDKVVISGFGTFEVRTRVAREGRNPRLYLYQLRRHLHSRLVRF